MQLPYSRKIWQELNLADSLESARAKISADLNMAVPYGIAIRIYACKKSGMCPHWLVVVGPTTTQPLLTTTQASFAPPSEHKKCLNATLDAILLYVG